MTALSAMPSAQADYLRLHVTASSNEYADRLVRTAVRDALIGRIAPLLEQAESLSEAETILSAQEERLRSVAEEVVRSYGKDYGVSLSIGEEYLPTRVYGSMTVEAGVYRTLTVTLGEGRGDRWWCVLYPPLCAQA
ncbi:MAG: stage II sporulation protein R [Christensenellaceae bacterium]